MPLWAVLVVGGVAWTIVVLVAAVFMRAAAIPTPRPGAGLRDPDADDA